MMYGYLLYIIRKLLPDIDIFPFVFLVRYRRLDLLCNSGNINDVSICKVYRNECMYVRVAKFLSRFVLVKTHKVE